MKTPRGTREAIFVTTVAAGFFIGAPLVAEASETSDLNLDPANPTINKFNTDNVLRYGHTGYSVSRLQLELRKLNLYYDQIDGQFGVKTRNAVKNFQILYNLKVDGLAGTETLQKLNELMATPSPKSLTEGDKGPEVELIQDKLKKLGYYEGIIDGEFGNYTKKSVITYQKKYHLESSGIATETTIDHIMQNINVKGPTIKTTKAKKVTSIQSESTTSYPVNSNVISTAMNYLGTPYVWGGTSPSGFDCSGFIQYVFKKHGMTIPRTVSDLWNFSSSVSKLSVGDIVFFQTYKAGPSHAGIYIGNGQFIHSSSSNGISISALSSNYWKQRYLGAKRVVQGG